MTKIFIFLLFSFLILGCASIQSPEKISSQTAIETTEEVVVLPDAEIKDTEKLRIK